MGKPKLLILIQWSFYREELVSVFTTPIENTCSVKNHSFTGHLECWSQISLELSKLNLVLPICLSHIFLNHTVFGWEKFTTVSIIKRNTQLTMSTTSRK